MNPIGIEQTLAHFRTAYAPKHHPELTAAQQVRINQIDAYRAQRQPRLKQNAERDVWLILACAWVFMAVIGCVIGLAIVMEWQPGDQEQILRAYKATQADAVEVAST